MNRASVTPHAGAAPLAGSTHLDNLGVALWLLMGVIGVMFGLFALAYVMRMAQGDAVPIGLPWPVVLSSACLVAADLAMRRARSASAGGDFAVARRGLLAGGLGAVAFLAAQFWAWRALAGAAVLPAVNPAASFFYVLTALHGLHLAGGLVAWERSWRALQRSPPDAGAAGGLALCARYWRFLLGVWLALLALLAGVTPELARELCGVG